MKPSATFVQTDFMKNWITLFFGVCSINAFSQELLKFENDKYIMQYPSGWTLDITENSGTEFMIFSPLINEEDQYQDFFRLTIMPQQGLNHNLESCTDQYVKDLSFFYQDLKIIMDEYTELGGRKCRHIQYSGSFNGFGLAQEDYIWLIADQSYTLNYCAELIDYWKLRDKSKELFKTFRFKNL